MNDAGPTQSGPTGGGADRRVGPVTLAELTAGLIWPTLLRGPAMAAQPSRVLIGLFTVAALALVAWLFDGVLSLFGAHALAAPLLEQMAQGFGAAVHSLLEFRFLHAADEFAQGAFGVVFGALGERPFLTTLLLLLLTPVWMVGGGAIARMVGVDVAGRVNMSASEGLSFSFRNVSGLVSAMLIPLALMGGLALALKIAGWLLLSVTVIDVIGGVLYAFLLLLGFLLVLLVIGFVLGQALLAPAVVVEGVDGVDAVQRAYAYVIGRPGRMVIYGALALALGSLVVAIARWIVASTLGVTESLTTSWLGAERGRALLGYEGVEAQPFAGWLIGEWHNLAWAIFAGFVVSLYFTLSTIVYMLLRRVNDEQDLREVWMEPERK